jgi:hypothetical protein
LASLLLFGGLSAVEIKAVSVTPEIVERFKKAYDVRSDFGWGVGLLVFHIMEVKA